MTLEQLRTERNLRLAACDFWMLSDFQSTVSEEEVVAMKLYRQALRDLPSTYNGTGVPNWPTPPITTNG
jgi:hypothetical protein